MRVSVGLFLVLGLVAAVGCRKKDAGEENSQAIGADNGVTLGEGTPQGVAVPAQGVVTPTRLSQPGQVTRPAFGPVGGTPAAVVPGTPAQPAAVQAPPPAAPVVKAPATPAAPAAVSPPAAAGGVAGRGVPPPPGGRPKPGTK